MDLMIVGLRLAPNCPAYYELVPSRGKFRGLWHEGIEGVSGIKILEWNAGSLTRLCGCCSPTSSHTARHQTKQPTRATENPGKKIRKIVFVMGFRVT